MKQLRRKDHQIENPAYMIFDMLHKSHFDAQTCDEKLSDRLSTLRGFLGGRNVDLDILRYTEQFQITDDDHFEYWSKMAVDKIFYNEASASKLGWDLTWFGCLDFDEDLIEAIKKWQRKKFTWQVVVECLAKHFMKFLI